jgi:hypothetical protein
MKKLILSLALLLAFTIIIPVYIFAGADYTTFTPHYGRISTYESGDSRYASSPSSNRYPCAVILRAAARFFHPGPEDLSIVHQLFCWYQ